MSQHKVLAQATRANHREGRKGSASIGDWPINGWPNFSIETIITDPDADLAAIKLFSDFKLPEPCEFYSLDKSRQLANGPRKFDGLSLIYFGFPVDNSLPLGTVAGRTAIFSLRARRLPLRQGTEYATMEEPPVLYFAREGFPAQVQPVAREYRALWLQRIRSVGRLGKSQSLVWGWSRS